MSFQARFASATRRLGEICVSHPEGVVFCFALVLRLVYLSEIHGTALERWHQWKESDMATYLEQSRQLAGGDWLGRDPYHPYHAWQKFAPAEQWLKWYPAQTFHQAPGYSYFLAVLRVCTPSYIDLAKLLQIICGSISAALVCALARAVFPRERAAPLWAGLLAAAYGPMLYLEPQILREGPSILLMLAGVLCLLWSTGSRQRSGLFLFAAGFLIALMFLFHESGQVVLVGALAAVFAVHFRENRNRAALNAAILFAGFLVGFSPWMARNIAVGAPPGSASSRSIVVFAMSNDISAPEGGAVWGASGPGLSETLNSGRGSLLRTAFSIAWSYRSDPMYFIQNLFHKICAQCAFHEAADNTSYAFFQTRVPLLNLLPGFWSIFAPSIGAIALLIAERLKGNKKQRMLLILVFFLAAALSLVHAIGRLRLVVVPLLIVLSVYFVLRLYQLNRGSPAERQRAKIVFGIAIASFAFQCWCQWWTAPGKLRWGDYITAAGFEDSMGLRQQAMEDYTESVALGNNDPKFVKAFCDRLRAMGLQEQAWHVEQLARDPDSVPRP